MSKIALGTWAWGAGAFGGDAVFGSKTDVENLKPVFDAAMKAGLNLWDTATVYGMGESEKILGSFVAGEKREDVEKFAHVASMGEIAENEFNLNIPRYVDTFEPEPEIDLNAVAKEIRGLQSEIKDIDAKLKPYFKELGLDFPFA